MAVAAVLGFATTASAGLASSSWGLYSVNGIDFLNRAMVYTEPSQNHYVVAGTQIKPANGDSVSVNGGMGALGRLFYDNGSLACSGSYYVYSSGYYPTGKVLQADSCIKYSANSWYSKGKTRALNGSGTYTTWYTFVSPSQTS